MKSRTDEELVAEINAGRSQALDELYKRYAGRLLVFCSSTMSCHHGEDMVHDVFMRVIEASDQFDASKASFRTWIFQIARNRCIDRMRRERVVEVSSLEGAEGHSGAAAMAGEGRRPEEIAMSDAVADAIRRCIGDLPSDEDRNAIVLFYLVGKVYREVGAIIGKSTSMAQKRVSLARERMKRCLRGKGVLA